ncbi:MAG TPA: HAMP domain-containing sensor histidine kinase, partial [Nitrososphaera sp.]|nr:HAMP domain-containing sensor histidine kinase [Nitrososphaera sp.]
LDVSRIESSTLELSKCKVDLGSIISFVLQDLEARTKEATIHYQPEHVFAYADKDRVIQVVFNLVDNAIKFVKGGGEVFVEVRTDGPEAIVSVRDTGPGIDPEIWPRLFSKFASKSENGTGLGLYISKRIIEAHGGRIWAENNSDGRGATFAFSLPLYSST